MNVEESPGQWRVTFNTQRLPRTLDTAYTPDEARLRSALPAEQCFLVAVAKDEPTILGYLTMRNDPIHQLASIHDLVVSQPYRRCGIGARLVKVARKWAREHGLIQMLLETHTRNYPGIVFCQHVGFTFCGFNDQYFANQDIAVFFGQSLR
jgi:GNAT superfamily N-acetyltransferase